LFYTRRKILFAANKKGERKEFRASAAKQSSYRRVFHCLLMDRFVVSLLAMTNSIPCLYMLFEPYACASKGLYLPLLLMGCHPHVNILGKQWIEKTGAIGINLTTYFFKYG
jgi:hypothetical protein